MKTIIPLWISLFVLFTISINAQSNKVLDFTGNNERVSINSPISGSDDFTAELWFTGTNGNITVAPLFGWGPLIGSGSRRFHVVSWSNQLRLIDDSYNGGSSFIATLPATIDDDGLWHHLAITKSGNTITLYLDDEQPFIYETGTSLPFKLMTDLNIGLTGSNENRSSWNGQVDEFRLWDEARSRAEIESTKNCELTGTETGLVLYYDFENTPQGFPPLILDRTVPSENGSMFNFNQLPSSNFSEVDLGLSPDCAADCETSFTSERVPCTSDYTFTAVDTDSGENFSWGNNRWRSKCGSFIFW